MHAHDSHQLTKTRQQLFEEMQIVSPHISLPHTPSWTTFLKDDLDLLERIDELEVTDDISKIFADLLEKLIEHTDIFAVCEELGIMRAVLDGFEHKPSEMTKYAYEELVFKKHQVEVSFLSADTSGSNTYFYGAWPDKRRFIYTLAKDGILPWEMHKYIHAKIHRLYPQQSFVSKLLQKFSPFEMGTEIIEVHAYRASLLPVDVVTSEELVDYMRLAVDEKDSPLFTMLDIEKARFAVHIIDVLNALRVKQKDIATMIQNRGNWNGKQYPRLYHAVLDIAHEKGFHADGLRHVVHEDALRKIRDQHIAKQLTRDELGRYKPLLARSEEELSSSLRPHHHA